MNKEQQGVRYIILGPTFKETWEIDITTKFSRLFGCLPISSKGLGDRR